MTPSPSARKRFADRAVVHHEAPDRDFDLVHLRLEISFDLEAKRLFGRATESFVALHPGVAVLSLD